MAQYPTSNLTDQDLYVAVNNAGTTLSASINDAVTTIPVVSTATFPADGIITIGAEAIHYTSKDATNFLGCTRAFDGTTNTSHAINDEVEHHVVAAHHNELKDELIALANDIRDKLGSTLGSVLFKAGTSGGFSFAGDLDTKFQQTSADTINVYTGGLQTFQMAYNSGNPFIGIRDGSAANPSLTFNADTDTGVYRSAPNQIAFAAGGEIQGQFVYVGAGTGYLQLPNNHYLSAPNGTVTNPSYTFTGVTGVGLYQASNNLIVANGGNPIAYFGPTNINLYSGSTDVLQIVSTGTRHQIDGSAASPSIHWASDTDTGIYRAGADDLRIVAGGTAMMAFVGGSSWIVPLADNTVSLGKVSGGNLRWSDVRSVLINGADYGFANGWILREYPCTAEDVQTKSAEWMKENANKGIQVLNDLGEKVCVIGRDGVVYAKSFKPLEELLV